MAVTTSALGLLRLRRTARVAPTIFRKCPDCGRPIRDRAAARLGFCDQCREFTGMCGAGRRIICPDVTTMTSWHTPCTHPGGAAWEITIAAGPRRTLLCDTHDAQVRSGGMPWVKEAVPRSR